MMIVLDQNGDLLSDCQSDGLGHWNRAFPPKGSALETTLASELAMSALPLKADMLSISIDVRYVP